MIDIRVLVVEDDPATANAHGQYVARTPGFALVGIAHTAAAARRAVRTAAARGAGIHLILLDLNLPDAFGLDLCRELRTAGIEVDVIAVTARRDLEVVRQAVTVGVVQYLIKPFAFPAFAAKLRAYREYFDRTRGTATAIDQHQLDSAFAALRAPTGAPRLPKGLSRDTLDAVSRIVNDGDRGWSAGELADRLGLSRVTGRRYLEFLCASGALSRSQRHGSRGRPELEYRRQERPRIGGPGGA